MNPSNEVSRIAIYNLLFGLPLFFTIVISAKTATANCMDAVNGIYQEGRGYCSGAAGYVPQCEEPPSGWRRANAITIELYPITSDEYGIEFIKRAVYRCLRRIENILYIRDGGIPLGVLWESSEECREEAAGKAEELADIHRQYIGNSCNIAVAGAPGKSSGDQDSVCATAECAQEQQSETPECDRERPAISLRHGITHSYPDFRSRPSTRLEPSTDCSDCPDSECFMVSVRLRITYSLSVRIEMPSMPNLAPFCACERLAIRSAFQQLRQHEQEHRRRWGTFRGSETVRIPSFKACRESIEGQLDRVAGPIEQDRYNQRYADADALSSAIDPYVVRPDFSGCYEETDDAQ